MKKIMIFGGFLLMIFVSSISSANTAGYWCHGVDFYYEPTWLNIDSPNGVTELTYTKSYIDSGSGLREYSKSTLSNLSCNRTGTFARECVGANDSDIYVKISELPSGLQVTAFAKGTSFDGGTYDGVNVPFRADFIGCEEYH